VGVGGWGSGCQNDESEAVFCHRQMLGMYVVARSLRCLLLTLLLLLLLLLLFRGFWRLLVVREGRDETFLPLPAVGPDSDGQQQQQQDQQQQQPQRRVGQAPDPPVLGATALADLPVDRWLVRNPLAAAAGQQGISLEQVRGSNSGFFRNARVLYYWVGQGVCVCVWRGGGCPDAIGPDISVKSVQTRRHNPMRPTRAGLPDTAGSLCIQHGKGLHTCCWYGVAPGNVCAGYGTAIGTILDMQCAAHSHTPLSQASSLPPPHTTTIHR
jgi:hypothetical protein